MEWIVIGAGPAGIAAVGKLIDQGISPARIGWIDPEFQVGDLGKKWSQALSYTTVDLFIRFFKECKAFSYEKRPKPFPIESLNSKENCLLKYVVEPLQWVTDHLKNKVEAIQDTAIAMNLKNNVWEIKTKHKICFAKNVILAIGSDPKNLNYPGREMISMDTALNPEKLAKAVKTSDTIGVFGASHSSVLILANLEKLKVKKIINFYRSSHIYAVPMKDWILFDHTGLKGHSAVWAKKYLDGEHPVHLKRVLVTDHIYEEMLSQCDKVIYAVGFERRQIPVLEQYSKMDYNDKTGIIAPGLFGVGIAFPQAVYDPLMNLEYRVGLWKFMDYLNTILPVWLKYSQMS